MYNLLHIICEHLHDLYTLNSLSGWKGLKKFIPRDWLNSTLIYILFSLVISLFSKRNVSSFVFTLKYFIFLKHETVKLKILNNFSNKKTFTLMLHWFFTEITLKGDHSFGLLPRFALYLYCTACTSYLNSNLYMYLKWSGVDSIL